MRTRLKALIIFFVTAIEYIPKRLCLIYKLLINKEYLFGETYYPEKSSGCFIKRLIHQLKFIAKYPELDEFYYLYGLDKPGRNSANYIPYWHFREIRDKCNLKLQDSRNYDYKCLLRDKFYFELIVNSLGFKTPRNLYFFDGRQWKDLVQKKYVTLTDIKNCFIDGFLKDISGECGVNVSSIRIEDGIIFIDDIPTKDNTIPLSGDRKYIIQERIVQHSGVGKLHRQSVNTVRLVTVMNGKKEIEVFAAGLRIGAGKKRVDNWAKGGIYVGIDIERGVLLKDGFLKPSYGTRVFEHPDSHIVFENYEIPFFCELVEQAKNLHACFYGIHSIGWDIAITEDGPCFLEGNDNWEVSLMQAPTEGLKTSFNEYFEQFVRRS